jgi:hypothetical protein
MSYVTLVPANPPVRADKHQCDIPLSSTVIFCPDIPYLRPAPLEYTDALIRCDECGQHWHHIGFWWAPVDDKKALKIQRKYLKKLRRKRTTRTGPGIG